MRLDGRTSLLPGRGGLGHGDERGAGRRRRAGSPARRSRGDPPPGLGRASASAPVAAIREAIARWLAGPASDASSSAIAAATSADQLAIARQREEQRQGQLALA
jgi:hypothetical protein